MYVHLLINYVHYYEEICAIKYTKKKRKCKWDNINANRHYSILSLHLMALSCASWVHNSHFVDREAVGIFEDSSADDDIDRNFGFTTIVNVTFILVRLNYAF